MPCLLCRRSGEARGARVSALVLTLAFTALSGCADGSADEGTSLAAPRQASGGSSVTLPVDSGSTPMDSASPLSLTDRSTPMSEASLTVFDAGTRDSGMTPMPEASSPADVGSAPDAGGPRIDTGDGGFTPPSSEGGAWTLNPGSFEDCPPEPPPIPIVGGICLGIYYSCGWTNQSGETYSCICDWVHWLCV